MRQPRKILLYTHALTGGGAERVWALLASGLAQRGHDVLFVTDFDAPQNQGFIDPAVRRVTLDGNHLTDTLRLARLIRREKPDVTISALSLSNLKHTIAALLAFRRKHAVLSYHGYASSEPQSLSRVGYAATALITRLTAATVCVSDGLLNYVVNDWRADATKATRIYNPVDGGPLAPAASVDELRARGPVALSAGRFVSYKQFPRLIRAFAQVPNPDARLVILGEGPERPAIEAEIARLGLQDRVSLPGYVSEPWTYYAKASCFVLASEQEPFGLVVVEALANGLGVVAADCHGPREILGNGQFGVLTPQNDEAALARAITAALADPGDSAPRVERAKAFSVERGLDDYEDLIDEVAGRHETRKGRQYASSSSATLGGETVAGPASGGVHLSAPLLPVTQTRNAQSSKRKILVYMHSLTGGGAERAYSLLATGLARRGHDVIIAVDYDSKDNDVYLDPAIRKVTLGNNHLRATTGLAKLLATEKPDVSISAMGASNLKHVAAALFSARRKRAVLSYHGFFKSEPKLLSRLSFALTPIITRLTARTVAVSKALRKNLVETWRADPVRTSRIYNPISWGASGPAPSWTELKARVPMVLASGRLIPLKNFDVLLRAFARVRPMSARLVILGEGPERARLIAEIERLGLSDRVEMPGYVQEPWDYYARATCVAVASQSESFGMTVVEGLAHGLPVVSSDCHGPSEILGYGRYGRIVPIGDEEALAGALSATLADPGDPASRLKRAKKFLSEGAIVSYERLFEDVCEALEPVARAAPAVTA